MCALTITSRHQVQKQNNPLPKRKRTHFFYNNCKLKKLMSFLKQVSFCQELAKSHTSLPTHQPKPSYLAPPPSLPCCPHLPKNKQTKIYSFIYEIIALGDLGKPRWCCCRIYFQQASQLATSLFCETESRNMARKPRHYTLWYQHLTAPGFVHVSIAAYLLQDQYLILQRKYVLNFHRLIFATHHVRERSSFSPVFEHCPNFTFSWIDCKFQFC